MNTCLKSAARGVAPLTPALQLIAITAASWNLIAPVRSRQRVRRIALRSLVRTSGCGAAVGAA
ncbi:hypothetical protein [Pantoea sp. 18069]|uniref:hypothetical protein n=1 Tax=Pantoea sp. 18069 TaxID=2681415 RepID=UPI00135CE07D|nr:hypothetical protein [Pantoea sp. 18069]